MRRGRRRRAGAQIIHYFLIQFTIQEGLRWGGGHGLETTTTTTTVETAAAPKQKTTDENDNNDNNNNNQR